MGSCGLTTCRPGYRPTLLDMKPGLVSTASETPDLFPLLAHQGGWDEILLVAAPLVLIACLLYIANRRVDAKLAERAESDAKPQS